MTFRVSKQDSVDLGFAKGCLLSAAITREEFNQWLYLAIEKSEVLLPDYMYELPDAEISEMFEIIGFAPVSGVDTQAEMRAVSGIAYLRGVFYTPPGYDITVSREAGLRALDKNPHILERFRSSFPFIEI